MKKVIRDFECAMCGQCCASQDLVQLTAYELFKLAGFLRMEPAAFFNKYCLVTATSLNPVPHIYIKTLDGACPFLEDQKCSVHDARPYACKAYPQRVYWSLASDMKKFVGSKYSSIDSCSLFDLDDQDVLLGDYGSLAKQTIAHWVDDVYFSTSAGEVDLSIPYRVADLYIHDPEMLGVAKRYVVNQEHPPSAYDAELAYAKISLTLQAALWNATSAFVTVKELSIHEDERIGKYMLATTDDEAVKALRLLVESGRMDLVKTLASASKAREGGSIIGSAYGSSFDHIALCFLFETDKETLELLTDNGKKPLFIFFRSDTPGDGKLAGFQINIKI